MRWAPLCICIDKKRKWRCLKKKRNLHYQNTFEQISNRFLDRMIFILLCNCVLFLSLTTVNSVIRRISAQSTRRSSHPARRDEYRTVRNADGQPDVSAGKGWDGWWFVCVYLVLEELVGILLYSMLLCIKSLTVFSGFGEHRSWKDISHFPHEKSLSWKREANDNKKQRKGKTAVLFHHASAPETEWRLHHIFLSLFLFFGK